MSSLDSREKLIDLEGKGRGKGKDKRAKGHEGKRAKGHKGKRAKTTNYNFPMVAPYKASGLALLVTSIHKNKPVSFQSGGAFMAMVI